MSYSINDSLPTIVRSILYFFKGTVFSDACIVDNPLRGIGTEILWSKFFETRRDEMWAKAADK